jgi:tetratricopeptide (TPR) repeat protein
MLIDRYGLALATAAAAARDAYVEGGDLALTLYPGAAEAYDRAIATDPGFALAHAGKAQVLMRQGQVAAARAALTAAKEVAAGLSEREASHIGFFDLVFAGQTDAAIAALHEHLAAWPRDALVVASAASPNGVIGSSGRIGQKHQIAALMDSLAPHYGDDFWFLSYHAMARCPRMDNSARRARRSSNPWPRTPRTRMAHMASPMFVTKAAKWMPPAVSSPRGLPPIRAKAFSMVI